VSFTNIDNHDDNNNVIYNSYSAEEISNQRCKQSQVNKRLIVSVTGQLIKEVRFKLTFKRSYISRSFDSGL